MLFIYNLKVIKHATLYVGDYYEQENYDYIHVDIHDYRVTDLIVDINNNIEIDHKKIQYLLVKCDNVYIKMGTNDLKDEKINYQKIDEFLNNLENLLTLLRKYNKEKIYFDLIEVDEPYQAYFNNQITVLMSKYGIKYGFTKSLK